MEIFCRLKDKNSHMMSYRDFVRTFVLCVAVILVGDFCINYVVDPFNVNRVFDLGFDKDKVSYRSNYRLYRMNAFLHAPCSNICLGDSRIAGLSYTKIQEQSGEAFFNFAYGGGTAYEIVDTFWFAARHTQLKNVYIGVNFNLYNQKNRMNLVKEAEEIIEHPLQHYLSLTTGKITAYNLLYRIFGINMVKESPEADKEEFWQSQLGRTTQAFYGAYIYPQDLYEEFRRIADYCKENNINLVFLFPPTHEDLQRKVEEYHLTQEYGRYKEDFHALGTVYDFDVFCAMNERKDLYKDPYHADEQIKDFVVKTVWGKMNPNDVMRTSPWQ